MIAIECFIFAKIPYTRKLIDNHLGSTFVSDNGINTIPDRVIQGGACCGAALCIKHGDDFVNSYMNSLMLENKRKSAELAGEILSRKEVMDTLNRPSSTQEMVQCVVDTYGKVVGVTADVSVDVSSDTTVTTPQENVQAEAAGSTVQQKSSGASFRAALRTASNTPKNT
jgi:hypothetical protein